MEKPAPEVLDAGKELPFESVRSANIVDIVSKETREPSAVALLRMKYQFYLAMARMLSMSLFASVAALFMLKAFFSPQADADLRGRIITGATGIAASLLGAIIGRAGKERDEAG